MSRAAAYYRISRDAEQRGLGVARQRLEVEQLAERHGLDIVISFEDNDLSAYRQRKPRPGYRDLVDVIKAGDVDTIVAWHPDRLTRQQRELEDLVDLLDATGVSIVTVTAGTYDLSTPSGRMVAHVIGATAMYESEHKAERIQSKHAELARDGKPSGGPAPYGYRYERPDAARGKGNLVVDPDEARWVRFMADRILDGDSLLAVARALNAQGVRTGAATCGLRRRSATCW